MNRLALLLFVLVAACGGNPSSPGPAGATPTPTATTAAVTPAPSALVLAAKARCTRPVVLPEPPLLVAQAVDCHGSGWTVKSKYPDDFPDDSVSFMTFNNNEGRDAWLQVAATLGDHGVIKGDRFVVEIPDQLPDLEPLALRLAEWLSGERVL